ncbi:copper homeostasis protein CutC [Clostridium algidicarnis]|uniref:PF03932 family protein CutC n=2 Tax=Clostridium algidicarnis TaxID=37659 RepID=A0A2S6FZ94_9CLOT|nr:copper homeostasis protein CutC [Clostridium algidicarnis]MBB6631044.1 copper homeostasis protein CutC [Clostridium algidicarnis]MBB6698221.1 copper homeostasis protein CutC [Clostridium algidicarnis]MBU3194262.1 copper homeostasis protein CutC [Clostridium algidicarnis]MBU3203816.1 copper homeostasis protein CutC [Clostridium algidicarnis]MBU3205916.1 copper homeostasis protein CutC [Clostridium algidicarnis]
MDLKLECCVGNFNDAKRADILGAHRIELCDNLLEGGTTPSLGTILMAKEKLNSDIMVIIRPRGGNFNYSKDEFEIMKKDIIYCKESGVSGVVLGILDDENNIDINRTKELVDMAKPMEITFHMAFDEIKDKKVAIDNLIKLGVNRILTKGGAKSAIEGRDCIRELINYSKDKIIIMPGGGVTKDNYNELVKYTGAVEVHGSKIV